MEGGESLESFFGSSADQFSATKGPLLLLDPFLSPWRIGLGGGSAFNGIGSGERGIDWGWHMRKGGGFRVFFLHGLAYVSRKRKCGNGVVRWEVKSSCGVTSADAARASLCHVCTQCDESRPGIYQLHDRRTQQETYHFFVYTYSGKPFKKKLLNITCLSSNVSNIRRYFSFLRNVGDIIHV